MSKKTSPQKDGEKLWATYAGTLMQESHNDQPDYLMHVFTNVRDNRKRKKPDLYFKRTKLLEAASLKVGKIYTLTISRDSFYPSEISWDKEKLYIKNHNSIIHVDEFGKETNLSYNSVLQELGKLKREWTLKQRQKK